MTAAWTERGTVLIQLGCHHFAFYRGYLDGLDLRTLAHRYLETTPDDSSSEMDLRVAKSMVRWIQDQLVVIARRTGNSSTVKLLRVAPESLSATYAQSVPSLEEFREERDPHEMFSEKELLDLFNDEFGAADKAAQRRTRRNNRLRSKQRAILKRLEQLTNAEPRLDDGVDGWLDPVIARRLIAVGLTSLGQLVTAINNSGFRWYTKVPRVGIKAAKQIVDWLMLPETVESLGVRLSARGILPRKDLTPEMLPAAPMRTAIVPLENLLVPHELNGALGTNRGEKATFGARNDLEAIHAWLSLRKPGSHTARAYRKEAERFLLWSILEAGKPISSLTAEDCISYRNFLWHLGRQTPEDWARHYTIPQDRWTGQRGIDRFSPLWRPFEGPLSPVSQKTALVILQSMMQWLTEQNYLYNNPFKGLPHLAKRAAEGIDASRALTVTEWKLMKGYLDTLPRDGRYHRLRFILALAYSSGCRLSELVSLRRSDLRSFTRTGEKGLQWEIVVTGTGNTTRSVQLNHHVIDEIGAYFRVRGHASLNDAPPDAPLIAALPALGQSGDADAPLSASRLYKVLKTFFEGAALSVANEDTVLAKKLRSASTHWLRHTFATHGIQNGMALETIRDLLGHRSLATTFVYVTTEQDKRSREVEKLGDLAAF
jgi:site-specific recombinase XerD